jgi:hypothetical protein
MVFLIVSNQLHTLGQEEPENCQKSVFLNFQPLISPAGKPIHLDGLRLGPLSQVKEATLCQLLLKLSAGTLLLVLQ